MLAGRDLEQGGTWLGITRRGRWAALTNYREPGSRPDACSRGHLVLRALNEEHPLEQCLEHIAGERSAYNGFNLLAGDAERLLYLSNRAPGPRDLQPGVYALSNHVLDSPWPKVVTGRDRLSMLLNDGPDPDSLFDLLADRSIAADRDLPDTGVGLAAERWLSPVFVSRPDAGYGTRCSTVILVRPDGQVWFEERSFLPDERSKHDPCCYRSAGYQFRVPR